MLEQGVSCVGYRPGALALVALVATQFITSKSDDGLQVHPDQAPIAAFASPFHI